MITLILLPMSLLDDIRQDIADITSDSEGFGQEIVLTAPDATTLTITGLHTKIHLGVDTDGNMVNSKKAHVSFAEKFLTDASYPVRNTKGEVDLKKHKVDVKDSTGLVKNYLVKEWFPDETLGLIVCILEDRE